MQETAVQKPSLSFTQKANLIRLLHRLLRRRYGRREFRRPIHPVEHAVSAILSEEATAEQVEAAMNRLRRSFVDWNEVRVSRPREIRQVLGHLPLAAAKADQIPLLLHQVFMRHHSMVWGDFLEGMNKRQMRTFFEQVPGLRPYVAAVMSRDYAGAHAFPIDSDVRRVLVRLGLLESEMPDAEAHAFMERAVKSNQGYELYVLVRNLAEKVCTSGRPKCGRCPLRQRCPSASQYLKRKARRGKQAGKKPGKKTKRKKGG